MASDAQMPVRPGDLLAGKYRVDSVLATGGMGIVVAATHQQLRQQVAIKVLRVESLGDRQAVARFEREARAVALIRNDHVARIFDIGTLDGGVPFMVMELLQGSDLAQISSERGRLPVDEALSYLLQACEAVAAAHAAGVVHRDLKPSNLFLATISGGGARVKVVDFGISKLISLEQNEAELSLTLDFETLGSPAYMSPEQMLCSRDVDSRTDVWSLGVIAYRLVTGVLPFRGATVPEVCSKILSDEPARPETLEPSIPQGVSRALLRCLEKDPSRRWQSVAELAAALAVHADDEGRAAAQRAARILEATPPPIVLPSDAQEPRAGRVADGDTGDIAPTQRYSAMPLAERRPRALWAVAALALCVVAIALIVARAPSAAPSVVSPPSPATAPAATHRPAAAAEPADGSGASSAAPVDSAARPSPAALRRAAKGLASSAPASAPSPTSGSISPTAAPPAKTAGDDHPLHL